MDLLAGARAVNVVSEVLPQLVLVVPQFVAIGLPPAPVISGFGFVPLILLPILMELLEIVLQVGGIARGNIVLDRFLLGVQVLAVLLQLLFVIVQGLASVVHFVVIVLDRMGLLVFGPSISRQPDEPCDCQRQHYLLDHCPLL